MNIAIYYPWVYLTSGIERTILEITRIKGHRFTIFTNHYEPQHTYPEFKNLKVIELKPISVHRDLRSVLQAATIIATQKIDLSQFDLLFIQSEGLGDLIAFRNHHVPTISFYHTPLRPVFDVHYRQFALRQKSLAYKSAFHLFRLIFKIVDQQAVRLMKHVIFNSQETKNRAIKGGLVTNQDSQMSIIHPGVNWQNINPSSSFKSYFLLPGRIMWTKHIELAIRSFIRFKKQNPQHKKFKLVIAGQVDQKSHQYLKDLQKLSKRRHDIQFITNPTDAQLNTLYSHTYAVMSCAFNEDWGITLLEGNAYGKPVIAIKRGGPLENQIDQQTGFLVKDRPSTIAQALKRLADDRSLTKQMGIQARQRSKQYSWRQFRRQVNSVIMNIV